MVNRNRLFMKMFRTVRDRPSVDYGDLQVEQGEGGGVDVFKEQQPGSGYAVLAEHASSSGFAHD